MRGLTLYALVGCVVLCLTGSDAQSTSSQPPGYFAGYLNRYTREDQCVYSFVVPKKERDQCPGLRSQVEEMAKQLKALGDDHDQTKIMINQLLNNKKSWETVGTLRAENDQLTREKTELIAQVGRLQSEKDAEVNRVTQLDVKIETQRSQLEALRAKYIPLEGNYTKLLDSFKRLKEEMEKTQKERDGFQSSVVSLKKAKNCTTISKHLPTCAAIKRMGYLQSGPSMIDPDGEGGVDPFLVHCDMDTDPSTGITVINHNHTKETPVIGCEKPGCLKQQIDYNGVSIDQIAKLIEQSYACSQYIKYDCYDSKLLKDGTGWWDSRHGQRMNYWGDALSGSNKCSCGMTGTCADKNADCNCDADSEKWLSDEGFLRDKIHLPVTKLNFGDVSQNSGEKGKSTLGPLHCKWDVGYKVPSCEALEEAGVTISGQYLVSIGDEGETEELQCDMKTVSMPVVNNNIQAMSNKTNVGHTVTQLKSNGEDLFVFTDCGQKPGRYGPSEDMCNHTYANTKVRVTVKDGIQKWVVPKTGRYKITAKGPAGQHFSQLNAGRGAIVEGIFNLKKDDKLKILVGQKGTRNEGKPFYGGSGGTFVAEWKDWVLFTLMVAGGGGSGSQKNSPANYLVTDASKTSDGKDGSLFGANFGHGGTDGDGGERGNRATGPNTPGGGAGWSHDGTVSGETRWGEVQEARAFTKTNGQGDDAPGVGGRFKDSAGLEYDGGFGGGGSAALHSCGGAGGYSGGGGGPDEGYSGGGGSIGKGLDSIISIKNEKDGEVRIQYLGSN